MHTNKQIALILLKQVLWGVRRGTTNGGICGLFNRKLNRLIRRARNRNVEVELPELMFIRKDLMREACAHLGWEISSFPVPSPDHRPPHTAYTDSFNQGKLWEGEYGRNRMKLLCRMIWILKTQIYLEQSK